MCCSWLRNKNDVRQMVVLVCSPFCAWETWSRRIPHISWVVCEHGKYWVIKISRSPVSKEEKEIRVSLMKQWKQCQTLFFGGSTITADGNCSHEIRRRLLLGRQVMTNLDSIFKSRDITLPNKVCLVIKAMVFPVVIMDERVGLWRRLSTNELTLLNCGVGEDSWESFGLQGDPTSPFWRRSALGVLWKEWC